LPLSIPNIENVQTTGSIIGYKHIIVEVLSSNFVHIAQVFTTRPPTFEPTGLSLLWAGS